MTKPLTTLREYVQAVRNIFDGKDEATATLGLPSMKVDDKIPVYLEPVTTIATHG